jgi:sugar lactone lactonase YvrE
MRAPSTTERAAERLTEPVDQVGESPVWRAGENALYWVDIAGRSVNRLELANNKRTAWKTEEMPACLVFARDGALLAAMETGIFSLELGVGVARARRLASVTHPMGSMRFNDGRCDRQGRFWAGTMHMQMSEAQAVGSLYRYDPDGSLAGPLESGLVTQNGLAWSPDGRRMYLSDSHASVNRVWCFDYDRDSGLPGNRRLFVDMSQHGGRPDGAAIDAEGCYWICANDGGAVLRFTPEGKLDRRLVVPTAKPTMCAFGGAGLDTLFVTSIRPANPELLAQQPLGGAVFALYPGVKGLPEPEFGD